MPLDHYVKLIQNSFFWVQHKYKVLFVLVLNIQHIVWSNRCVFAHMHAHAYVIMCHKGKEF